jgi:tRNA modification GTPase
MSAPAPSEQTYLARLTPPGVSAIATLALRGPKAWQVARELFRPGTARAAGDVEPTFPTEPSPGRMWLGRVGDASAGVADEVVLAVKRGGPIPWLELHCHGGREVLRLLEETITARDVQAIPWEQLERQTTDDLSRAAALEALTRAVTTRTASILLDQFHGACARAIDQVRSLLNRGDPAEAFTQLEALCRHDCLGCHLTEPWRVVVAGPPNVGKSSLVNALAGYQRCIVASTPGTTRDVVTTLVALDGWPVELADSAGWREGAEALEEAGITRAKQAAAQADLCLWLMDGSTEPLWPPAGLDASLCVINKVDLPPAWDTSAVPGALRVSARAGEGLPALCDAISRRLVPSPPPVGSPVPFTPALCDRLHQALQSLRAGHQEMALQLLENVWAACS